MAALVWSYFPDCGADVIRQVLRDTALKLPPGETGRNNDYGYGLVQAKNAVDYLTANGCDRPKDTVMLDLNLTSQQTRL